jgi:hypothetical protein
VNGKRLLEQVDWCSICNARPADGTLTVLLEGIETPQDIPACTPCVMAIPKEDWIDRNDLC